MGRANVNDVATCVDADAKVVRVGEALRMSRRRYYLRGASSAGTGELSASPREKFIGPGGLVVAVPSRRWNGFQVHCAFSLPVVTVSTLAA